MIVGSRIRAIREEKKLCQIDLAVRAGLLQSFLSKVESGDAVPNLEALDRIAAALEVPLHKLFYDGDVPPALPNLPDRRTIAEIVDGGRRKDRRQIGELNLNSRKRKPISFD
jgi:transcriptional regulator with XRE-family HTH domain